MKIEDVKKGMKVTITENETVKKWLEDDRENNATYFKKNGFINVLRISGNIVYFYGDDKTRTNSHVASELEPYIESTKIKKETSKMPSEKKLTQKEIIAQVKKERGRKVRDLRETLGIERIIINGTALIVFFKDGTKVIEKAVGGDDFSLEIGISLSYLHKLSGSKSIFKEAIDKYTKMTELQK